jgi:hypothetical protein
VQQCKTGQEGPVRAGQVIVRLGCAVRWFVWPAVGASEMSGLVCLSASEAYLCSLGGRERQTRRYLDKSHEPEQLKRELGRLSTVSPAPC